MGLLKRSKLKGMPEFNINHKADTVEVTIFWKRPTPTDLKKKKKTSPQLPAKPTKPPNVKPATKSQQNAVHRSKPATAPRQKIQILPKPTHIPMPKPTPQ